MVGRNTLTLRVSTITLLLAMVVLSFVISFSKQRQHNQQCPSSASFHTRTGHASTNREQLGGRTVSLLSGSCDNPVALDALVKWASRFPNADAQDHLFPFCENRKNDPTQPTKGWRTAWRHALRTAGFHCRFHDLRVTCISKLAESQTSDMTIMAIAGHVSRRMLEHYSRIRVEAKRRALDGLSNAIIDSAVHQNVNQIAGSNSAMDAKLLN